MIDTIELAQQVEDVIRFSQAYDCNMNCTPLIEQWFQAKKPFINLFNGQLIYKVPEKISIEIPQEEREQSFVHFITALTEAGIFTKAQQCGDLSLLDFFYENKEGFLSNRVMIPHPELQISKNQKLLRVVKKFFTEDQTTRWVQDTASIYIQNEKLEGYLYFSVHPLDYLLLSETNCNWTSCHALDGDYRHGNLSYMVDHTTIVTYIADEKKEHLRCLPPGMTWYNKKWRELIHTNLTSVIYYGKGYPFFSKNLVKMVCEHLDDALQLNDSFSSPIEVGFREIKTTWGETELLAQSFINYLGEIRPARSYIDYDDYFGFPDLTSSLSAYPIVSIKKSMMYGVEDKHLIFDIKIGEKPMCPICGCKEITESGEYTSIMTCSLCAEDIGLDDGQFYLECDGCHHRIYDEEEAYKFDDSHDVYCKKCYNSLTEGEKKHGKAWRRSKRSDK